MEVDGLDSGGTFREIPVYSQVMVIQFIFIRHEHKGCVWRLLGAQHVAVNRNRAIKFNKAVWFVR